MDGTLYVGSFRDLLPAIDDSADIYCLIKSKIVRTIERHGDIVSIKAGKDEIVVCVDTPITYQPWDMDRGSLVFEFNGHQLKIATELDIMEYHGQQGTVSLQPKSRIPDAEENEKRRKNEMEDALRQMEFHHAEWMNTPIWDKNHAAIVKAKDESVTLYIKARKAWELSKL